MVIDPGNNLNNALGKSSSTAGSGRTRQSATTEAATENKAAASKESDSVSLSNKGQTLAKMEAKLSNMPEVDESKVAEVRSELANGTYSVDADAIAEKLLDQEQLL